MGPALGTVSMLAAQGYHLPHVGAVVATFGRGTTLSTGAAFTTRLWSRRGNAIVSASR